MTRHDVVRSLALALVAALAAGAPAAPPPADDGTPPPPRSDVEILIEEVEHLRAELEAVRRALADAELEAAEARRERDELRQFIADHRELGRDFEAYTAVLEQAGRDARTREIEARRERYEARKAERRERYEAARAARAEREEARERREAYDEAGFGPLGLDVYLGRMAYSYGTEDATGTRVDYSPRLGHYLRLYPALRIDYSSMTISGSVLNAADEVRNIGIAITFFDESGNQVGAETVQVSNARPNVPYPFTSTVAMALDRPFASSSQHVLYADAVPRE